MLSWEVEFMAACDWSMLLDCDIMLTGEDIMLDCDVMWGEEIMG